MDWVLLTEVFVTLFVIMDPVGTIPIFLSLTGGRSAQVARRAAWQAVAVSFGVISAFAFFGQQILEYLHISLPALQCAGGLLLLLVALELLTGKESEQTANADTNVALVPLGTPLLAGPGAIVATMVFSKQVDDFAEFAAVALGVIARPCRALAVDAVLAADPAADPGERRPAGDPDRGTPALARSPCRWSPTPCARSSPARAEAMFVEQRARERSAEAYLRPMPWNRWSSPAGTYRAPVTIAL